MRNDLISLIFSNDDGSEVTMPATQLLEISSSLQMLLSAVGANYSEPISFLVEVAAADRGSFRLSFKWTPRAERNTQTGVTVENVSKIAQTAFHVVSTVSVLLVLSGFGSWQQDKQPHQQDIASQVEQAQKPDHRGQQYDAAAKFANSVIVVKADNVILETPSVPPVAIVGADATYRGLLASKPRNPLPQLLTAGTDNIGPPTERTVRLMPYGTMRAMVDGIEKKLRIGQVVDNGVTYTFIVLWNSIQEVNDMHVIDMPPYVVKCRIAKDIPNIEPIDPVTGVYRNADGYLIVDGAKTFQ